MSKKWATLYKYISSEHAADIIQSQQLRMSDGSNFNDPFELLVVDKKEHTEQHINGIQILYIQAQEPSVLAAVRNAVENPSGKATVTLTIPMVAHCITNNKQFERFYWPTLKKCIDMVVEADKQFFIFCEADILRLKEFFQDIPKGHGLILCEQDSIYDVRREMPNFAVAGGMPGSLLGYGTPAECVDYAKKLIDDMGDGYVFSTQKILAFKNDAKRENLMAVYDFIYNYTR